jgi:hypothetical protein
MTRFLHANGVRIFDYPQFAMTQWDRVRDRAASLAAEAGVTIEHIGIVHIRKEDVVARVLEQRGDRPGLVHILSAMETCEAPVQFAGLPILPAVWRVEGGAMAGFRGWISCLRVGTSIARSSCCA